MTKTKKINFEDSNGEKYDAIIHFSLFSSQQYAILMHCFDVIEHPDALKKIIHSLVGLGINVFQFESADKNKKKSGFKGLCDPNKVSSILAANQFLSEHYVPPSLILGHGINGLVGFIASAQLDHIKGVVLISSCTPDSIIDNPQRFKKDFSEDLSLLDIASIFNRFSKPLLIFHSQSDKVIPISESLTFYEKVKGIKSFILLEKTDHFLNDAIELEYIVNVMIVWVKKWIFLNPIRSSIRSHQVVVHSNLNLEQKIFTQLNEWSADEPASNGGDDKGPDPFALLLSALGACTNMTLKIYALHKNIDLGDIKTILSYEKKSLDKGQPSKISFVISREIIIENQSLTPEVLVSLEKIANKCPVHKTLMGDIVIETKTYQAHEK